MELAKIEQLVARYEEGETSLAEEKVLKNYFSTHEVPAHLQVYKTIFAYTASAKSDDFEVKLPQKEHKEIYLWSSVAATIVLALGLFFYQDNLPVQNTGELGTIEDPELALEKTRETLELVSQYMNEGREDLKYLKEFNITKNKFIKEN